MHLIWTCSAAWQQQMHDWQPGWLQQQQLLLVQVMCQILQRSRHQQQGMLVMQLPTVQGAEAAAAAAAAAAALALFRVVLADLPTQPMMSQQLLEIPPLMTTVLTLLNA
jgi:hypothetical protein